MKCIEASTALVVWVYATLFSGVLVAENSQYDDELVTKTKIMCFSCHGTRGRASVGEFPTLAGQSAKYLAKQLRDFKTGVRHDAVMSAIASQLSEHEINAIAQFYEDQGHSLCR